MVIDTQGPIISPAYAALLPGIHLRGIEPEALRGTPCHPHGALCGWLAGAPLVGAKVAAEIVFVRIFDRNAKWSATSQFILDAISKEQPDYITRSWGAWDGDSAMGELQAQTVMEDFIGPYQALQKRIGFLDFGAAGNNDENDDDNDVDFPQRVLDDSYVIGACHRHGVPTKWSGDGSNVLCVMWGDRVYSPDQGGRWTLWSGTSAACPKACGAAAAMNEEGLSFRGAVHALPADSRPAGNWKLPHPKWGWGCAEDLWQRYVARLPQRLMPPARKVASAEFEPLIYHDYRRLK